MKKYGWRPDKPDHRDHYRVVAPREIKTVNLLDSFKLPNVFDQGQLGSCTGNGIAWIIEFNLLNNLVSKKSNYIDLSRLFIYYNERVLEGTIREDAGAEIRDGIKTTVTNGVCSEKKYPYNIAKFTKKPTKTAYKEGLKLTSVAYERIDNSDYKNIVYALLDGHPVVCGFSVYESFESQQVANTGIVPMPNKRERLLGGHCVTIVGYDLPTNRFRLVNSWGLDWGQKGYFTMPAEYLGNTNLADDFWIIKMTK